jgi:hypothetical protein
MQVQIIRPDGRSITVGQGGNAGTITLPRTRGELDALAFRRSELENQVQRLRGERADLLRAIKEVGDGPSRPAYQLRMAEVDERIIRIEREIDAVSDQIAAAPTVIRGQVVTTAPPRVDPVERAIADNIIPLTGMLSTFFLLPLAIAFARLLWKRGTAVSARPALSEQAMVTRLEQLQMSMDTMALEVERISENQRYLTKQIGEKDRAALPR